MSVFIYDTCLGDNFAKQNKYNKSQIYMNICTYRFDILLEVYFIIANTHIPTNVFCLISNKGDFV